METFALFPINIDNKPTRNVVNVINNPICSMFLRSILLILDLASNIIFLFRRFFDSFSKNATLLANATVCSSRSLKRNGRQNEDGQYVLKSQSSNVIHEKLKRS